MSLQILNHQQSLAKIRRIAYQIIERNFSAPQITLVGIFERGFHVALLLDSYLRTIASIPVQTYSLNLNLPPKPFSPPLQFQDFENQIVVIVDDVLYTGNTLLKALMHVYQFNPQMIQIATLIDRGHRHYPISPDYVGLELATTFHEFVRIDITPEPLNIRAYLE
ncbi:MAG: phosphoribosyltransferase family protein [Bacteroidia bacterium]|nr:phosphoribosyltransferase family protein [Bacteroidia bacterium]MDW8158648.1 phosphoribosyltransferase family protein [Bacteroidia bacterium]